MMNNSENEFNDDNLNPLDGDPWYGNNILQQTVNGVVFYLLMIAVVVFWPLVRFTQWINSRKINLTYPSNSNKGN
jgi:hypothetical protein